MQIVKARFRSREEFDEAYVRDTPSGGIFVATTEPLEPGSDVVVELHCDGLPNKVLIRGVVRSWRPALPRLRVRAGAVVEFAADESVKRDFVLGQVGGAIPAARKRRHTRIPVSLPVEWRLVDTATMLQGELLEISIGGALLMADEQLPLGSELVLALTPPGGAAPMEILGKVTYHAGPRGTGLKFSFRDGGGARRLRELIRRVRAA